MGCHGGNAMLTTRRLRQSLLLTIIAVSLQLSGCWGSPAIGIVIENQTDEVLTVHFLGGNRGYDVAPRQQVVVEGPGNTGNYPIVAKNENGEIVFSETYTFMPEDKYHLVETNLQRRGVVKVYKAIIPPLATTSDNVTDNH
jgi:hypothetical protein